MVNNNQLNFNELTEAFSQFIAGLNEAVSCITDFCNSIIFEYPNKRVVHLALHAKKKRIRKKNLHRIYNDMFGG